MISYRRASSTIFYFVCFILAIACYYFTVSEALFTWFAPDELILSQTYHNLGGLFACTKYYYLHTTVNRLTSDFSGCLMAKGATFFSPFMGWVFSRLMVYILIPVSMAFLLRETLRMSLKKSFIAAFLIATFAWFVLETKTNYLYGFDLAIYGMASVSFFALLALFPKSVENQRCFVWFCIVYAINLMSHEIFLVISGFLIPIYAWYRYAHHAMSKEKTFYLFVKNALRDRNIWILLAVYLIGALVTTLAPGVEQRQDVWPTSGTFLDGVSYMVLSIEEVIYYMSRNYFLVILVFLLGMGFRLSISEHNYPRNNKLIYIFLFSTTWVYLLLLGFLTGLSPTLWGDSIRTEAFRWIEPFLTNFVSTPQLLSRGGLYISRILFLYLGIFLDIFLIGFLIAGSFKKCVKAVNAKKSWPLAMMLFLILSIVFLFHPDGAGSLRILSVLFDNKVNLNHYSPTANQKMHQETSLVGLLQSYYFKSPLLLDPAVKPRDEEVRARARASFAYDVSDVLFSRNKVLRHESGVTNIRVNNYLKAHRGEAISIAKLNLVYDLMLPAYALMKHQMIWQKATTALYNVFPKEACFLFSGGVKQEGRKLTCFNTFGKKNITRWLRHKKIMPPVSISFLQTEGVDLKKQGSHCLQVDDVSSGGEHFVASNQIQLSKGLYYFIFETKPTQAKLNLYIIGEKWKLLLSWLNAQVSWGKLGRNNSLQPIFSQVASDSKLESLRVVIYSAMDQKIYLRWQHGDMASASTIYKGKKGNVSSICAAEFGRIVNLKSRQGTA